MTADAGLKRKIIDCTVYDVGTWYTILYQYDEEVTDKADAYVLIN